MKKPKMNWILIFSIVGALSAIAIAFAQTFKDKKDDEERLRDKTEIIELQKKGLTELQAVTNLQAQLIAKSNDLQKANEKIQSLNEEINDYIKGSNINCHVDFAPIQSPRMKAFITNDGKNPIYNLKISFIDYKKLQQGNIQKLKDGHIVIDMNNIKSISKTLYIDEVSPKQVLFLDFDVDPVEYFDNNDPYKLEITYQSRGNEANYLLQQFVVANINNAWLQKSRLIRFTNNNPTIEKVINRIKPEEEWNIDWTKYFDLPFARYYLNFDVVGK